MDTPGQATTRPAWRAGAPVGLRPWLARIGLNSFWLLVARLLSQLFGLLFTAALARSLGAAGLGQFAFISTVLFLANVLTTFGLDTLLIREVAAERSEADQEAASRGHELVNVALVVQLALSVGVILLGWLAAPLLPNQTAETLPALRLTLLALIPLAFSTAYSAILRAHERMYLYLCFSLLTAVVMAAGGVALVVWEGGLLAAAAVVLVAQSIGAAAAGWLSWRYAPAYRPRWVRPVPGAFRFALRAGAALMTVMILSMLNQRTGLLLLSFLDGDDAAGSYSAGVRVIEALKVLPAAFFGAMFPLLAHEHRTGNAPQRLYKLTFAGVLGLSALLAGLVSLWAGPTIALLYGPGYEAAVPALRVMCWSIPVTVIAFKLSFDLVLKGHERVTALAMAATVLAGGVLTAWLIARASLMGAALALPLAESIQVICLLVFARLPARARAKDQGPSR